MPNDKTLPISLHETWPGVPTPSSLGPWTGNQAPRATTDNRAGIYIMHLPCTALNLRWMVLLGPRSVDQRQGLLCLIALRLRPMDRAPYHMAPRLGPRAFSISLVNSFGGNFVRLYILFTTNFKLTVPLSRRVASIIERIDLGCASNPMRVLISLTAASITLKVRQPLRL